MDQAETSMRRLAPAQERDQVQDAISAMVRTNQLEIDVKETTSWLSCFRGTDLLVLQVIKAAKRLMASPT